MFTRIAILLILAVALLLAACLDDIYPPVDYPVYLVMSLDPLLTPTETNFYLINEHGYGYSYIGKAYSFGPTKVFNIGDYLWAKTIGEYSSQRLLPYDFSCTDGKYLAANEEEEKLFVAAENNIYSLKFDGTELTNLTPTNTDTLSAPALSYDKRYLTYIRAGRINRLDLQTGATLELENAWDAEYAIYRPDQDRYYYFTRHYDALGRSLYSYGQEGVSTLIKQTEGYWDQFAVSLDGRRFGMLTEDGDQTPGMARMWLWDSNTGAVMEQINCRAFAFSPTGTEVYYSQKNYGSSNIFRHTFSSDATTMLYDGIMSQERFFNPITEITPKATGDMLYFVGFTYKYHNPETEN